VIKNRKRPEMETPYRAPADEAEKKLTGMWERFLGIEKVGIDDNFFDLGGDSLMAVSFLAGLKQETGMEIPVQIFFDSPTIGGVIGYCEKNAIKEQVTTEEPYLVYNRESSKAVFCFPPYLCYGFTYYDLSRYLKNYRLYCFNFRAKKDTIEKYVDSIITVQPTPPYVFFAHSAGGRVAYEVARLMHGKGAFVSDLVFLDSFSRWNTIDRFSYEREKKRSAGLLREYGFFFGSDENLLNTASENLIAYSRLIHTIEIESSIPSHIHQIHAEPQEETEENRDWHTYTIGNTWEPYTSAHYAEYQGCGTHMKLMHTENIAQNAAIIRNILESIFK
jgi:thioesterase domain-containing protein/acyl carrier protein